LPGLPRGWYPSDMGDQIRVSRTVQVPAEPLFALLADPARHIEFDTSGMVRGLESGAAVATVGDRFVMAMHNERLGDYRMRNTVVAFERDRAIGWAPELYPLDGYPGAGGMRVTGHTYHWGLVPAGPGATTVTLTYDWSGVTDPRFRERFPRLDAEQLRRSIGRVAEVARAPGASPG
jgi:uncharacterized protein YndB with AHSA1/START domain